MKKNIYLIVGEGRCGKSSLVRALTGVFRRSKKATRIASSNPEKTEIKIVVWPQSAQEANLSPKQVLADINALSNIPNVLLVLRFQRHVAQYNATDYIDLISEQHNIIQVVFMGPNEQVPEIPTPGIKRTLNLSYSRAINANAAMIREWWEWL